MRLDSMTLFSMTPYDGSCRLLVKNLLPIGERGNGLGIAYKLFAEIVSAFERLLICFLLGACLKNF